MQSYTGTIRLFPNWPADQDAAFHRLRAVGAFLVSAEMKDGQVARVEILSEAGSPLKLISPWDDGARVTNRKGTRTTADRLIEIDTAKGERITLVPQDPAAPPSTPTP